MPMKTIRPTSSLLPELHSLELEKTICNLELMDDQPCYEPVCARAAGRPHRAVLEELDPGA